MRLLSIFSVFFLMVGSAMALTLDEAINSALSTDDSMLQGQYQLEAQGYSSNATIGSFLPKVNLGYSYTDSTLYDDDLPNRDGKSGELSAGISLNLFNGLADMKSYQLGKNAYKMEELTFKGTREDILFNVKMAYINYLKAIDQYIVAEDMIELLKAQLNIAQISYDIGQFSRADVLQVEVQMAEVQLQLLNADIQVNIARQLLEKIIGRSLREGESVARLTVSESYPIPSLDELYTMLENRSELQYVSLAYDSAVLDKGMAKSSFMPKIDAGYQYSWTGDGANPFGGVPNSAPVSSSSYDEGSAISVTASWNLFNGLSNYNTYKSKSATANATAHAVSGLRKDLRLQVSTNYSNYFSAREMLAVAKAGYDMAAENYRVTKSMFDNSQATTTDLLDASVSLNRASTAYTAATYDIMLAVATIERAVEQRFLNID